jgi:hypothetical protein
MNVVFAVQSPTLLNILASSAKWNLLAMDLGDCGDLQEASLAKYKFWSGERDVKHVFVHSPQARVNARRRFPEAKLWWVLHTGSPDLATPVGAVNALVFSRSMKRIHSARNPQLRTSVVTPHYDAAPVWQWSQGVAWAMRNRPTTRSQEALKSLLHVADSVGESFTCYGQGWPAGFVDDARRAALQASCSAYVSALPKWAGFGLAEHECFAAGVPVVSSRWGDMDEEMPAEYWALHDDQDVQREALRRLVRDKDGAETLSRVGVDFIRSYRTKDRMDGEIEALLGSK